MVEIDNHGALQSILVRSRRRLVIASVILGVLLALPAFYAYRGYRMVSRAASHGVDFHAHITWFDRFAFHISASNDQALVGRDSV